MIWTLYRASEAFERHRGLWDQLNQGNADHILLDSAFVSLLLRHFGSPRVHLAVSRDPQRPGLALVESVRTGFWQTFQPSQAPLGLILLGSKDSAIQQTRDLLRALPGFALGLTVLQQDPECTPFSMLDSDGAVEIVPHIRTARVTLTGTFDGYWSARSKKLTTDLARQRRRLAERGAQLELVVDRRPHEVPDGVREYARLESAGWKASTGTAISSDNQQGAFYRELLEHFSFRGEGCIYRLLLDGKTVAANLSVERNGTLVVLKIAYDESIGGLSPGNLLEQEMLKALFMEGRVRVEEYYGPFTEWQARWTNEVRTVFHVNFWRTANVARVRRALKASSAWLHGLAKPSGSTPSGPEVSQAVSTREA